MSLDLHLQQLNVYLIQDLSKIVCDYLEHEGRVTFEIDFIPHESLKDPTDLKVKNWVNTTHQENIKTSIIRHINDSSNFCHIKKDFNLSFGVYKLKNFSFQICMFFEKKGEKNENKNLIEFYENLPYRISYMWNELADENYSVESKFRIGDFSVKRSFNKQMEVSRKNRLNQKLKQHLETL